MQRSREVTSISGRLKSVMLLQIFHWGECVAGHRAELDEALTSASGCAKYETPSFVADFCPISAAF